MKSATPLRHDASSCGRRAIRTVVVLAALSFATAAARAGDPVPTFRPGEDSIKTIEVAMPLIAAQLQLDDGSWEGTVGFGASQFLWFNQFDVPPTEFTLEEVHVLFPSGAGVAVGDAVQIVVWHDPNEDPMDGADLLTAFDSTVQSVDGSTFSIYPVAPSIVVPSGGDLLVGVINRYVVGGVPADSTPAALDTTSSQGRSWFAVWAGDPPDPPALPADSANSLIDPFIAGNWMIRAVGTAASASGIPDLQATGILVLVVLIGLGGALLLVRKVG